MGVGVYSNNFDETGGTFLVDGPDCTDDAYDAAMEDVDADERVDLETWMDDQQSDHSSMIDDAVSEALRSVGIELGANSDRDFENEFKVHTRDKGFVIGLRGWEHDTVVGVWQDEEYGEYQGHVNGDVVEMALRDGVLPSVMCQRRRQIADDLLELIRLEIQECGVDCRYKTSGWTSSQYPRLDEASLEARRAELQAQIKAGLAWVSRPYEQAIREEGAENFKGIIKLVVAEEPHWYRDAISAAFMAKGRNGIVAGPVDEDLQVGYTSEGGLHLDELGLSPDFGDQEVLPLPETPEIMTACIERYLKHLNWAISCGKSQPHCFLLPPDAVKEVLDLGTQDELVFVGFDVDEEPVEPEGPGMM